MKARPFARSGPLVSEVGLGCWQLGADWGNVEDKAADEILDAAVHAGVTFLDTADVYGAGLSEKRIAGLLSRTPVKPFVATKIGRFAEPGWPANFEEAAIRIHVDA